jgi:hypothetical protein
MNTISVSEIKFIEEDKKDKGLRKDINYLVKMFGEKIPKWLVTNVLKVRRGSRGFTLLSGKGSVYVDSQKEIT